MPNTALETSPSARSPLSLAERRSCAPQWRAFLEALAAGLPETVGNELALTTLAGVGRRMAQSHTLGACNTLEELEAAMNRVLDALDWGSIEVRETADSVELILTGFPCFGGVEGKALVAATVEGLLDGWMAALASRPNLAVRLADHGEGDYPCLVFRYGRLGPAA